MSLTQQNCVKYSNYPECWLLKFEYIFFTAETQLLIKTDKWYDKIMNALAYQQQSDSYQRIDQQ